MHQTRNVTRNGCPKPSQQRSRMNCESEGFQRPRPGGPGEVKTSGAERRMAGGIGAKKVDVTFATEESGEAVRACNARSSQSTSPTAPRGTPRRTLRTGAGTCSSRPSPCSSSVPLRCAGRDLSSSDEGAANDGTTARNSTFKNAHEAFRLFTHRDDPAGRDEQFERFYIVLHGHGTGAPSARSSPPNQQQTPVTLDTIFDQLIGLIGERNADLYEVVNGQLKPK